MEPHKSVLLISLILSLSLITSPVAAQDDPVDTVLKEDASITDRVSWAIGYAWGLTKRTLGSVNPFSDNEGVDGAEQADDIQSHLSDRDGKVADWVNNHLNIENPADYDLLKVRIEGSDSTGEFYINGTHNGDEFTGANVTDQKPDNGTVDYTITLEGLAAANAYNEYREFYNKFIQQDQQVSQNYAARKYGEYGDEISVES